MLCLVLQDCGLQLEGVSRQKIVSAKISHLKRFILPLSFLLPLVTVALALIAGTSVCSRLLCAHAFLIYMQVYMLCVYMSVSMHAQHI